jgi:ABC-type Fe3+ transport system substrate-binding protein
VEQSRIYLGLVVAAVVVLAAILLAAQQGGGPSTPTTAPPAATTTTPATATSMPQGQATSTAPSATTTSPAATATETGAPSGAGCKHWYTVRVLTRHPADIQEKARDAFLKSEIAKKYCVKDVLFIPISAGFWEIQIKQKRADLGWGGGPTLFDTLFLDNLLAPLKTKLALETAAQVPDTFAGMPMKRIKDSKIYWVAAAIASFGFTVNTDVAKKLGFDVGKLRHWSDLASDNLGLLLLKTGSPQLAIANPLMSTSNTRMYEIILQAYGWENGWRNLTLMAANAIIEQGSAAVRDDVINGRVMVGITIDFYGYTAEKVNPACRYILPQGETIVNGDPIAVTTGTNNQTAAEAFLAWVLTEGQAIWLDPAINRLPANPHVFDMPVEKLAEIDRVSPEVMAQQVKLLRAKYEQAKNAKTMKFNDTLALMTESTMQQYFVATLVDNHNLLVRAWTKLLKAYYIDHSISKQKFLELKKKLTDIVTYKDPVTGKMVKFTLEDAIRVNRILQEALKKGNAKLAEEYMNAWRAAARAKYQEVLAALGG